MGKCYLPNNSNAILRSHIFYHHTALTTLQMGQKNPKSFVANWPAIHVIQARAVHTILWILCKALLCPTVHLLHCCRHDWMTAISDLSFNNPQVHPHSLCPVLQWTLKCSCLSLNAEYQNQSGRKPTHQLYCCQLSDTVLKYSPSNSIMAQRMLRQGFCFKVGKSSVIPRIDISSSCSQQINNSTVWWFLFLFFFICLFCFAWSEISLANKRMWSVQEFDPLCRVKHESCAGRDCYL